MIVIVLLIQDADTFKRKSMYNLAGVGVVLIDVMMLSVMVWSAWRRARAEGSTAGKASGGAVTAPTAEREALLREIETLKECDSDNIVRYRPHRRPDTPSRAQ